VYIDYYNELVSYNADLIQADLTYTRDKEGFKETSETNKGIYIKIGALGTELVPPEPEGPPPKETLLEVIVEGLALGSGEELLHLVDREITEVERHFVSPVGQFNGSYLQLAEDNPLRLAQAFGSHQAAVACATATVIEEAPAVTGRGLSPNSREQGQRENTRQRTGN
jgi:hypothetical protein